MADAAVATQRVPADALCRLHQDWCHQLTADGQMQKEFEACAVLSRQSFWVVTDGTGSSSNVDSPLLLVVCW